MKLLLSDKKALSLLEESQRKPLADEDKAYCIEKGVLSEYIPMSHDEAVIQIKQLAEKILYDKAAKAFLYSVSSGDYRYRTVLSSLVWAKSLFAHNCESGREYQGRFQCKVCGMDMSLESGKTNLNITKYCRERLFPKKNFMDICCAGYVLNDLSEFTKLSEVEFVDDDIRILNRIFGLAKEISSANKVNALLKRVSVDKSIAITVNDASSVIGVLASCGVFDTPDHRSYASGFVRCDEREFVYETDIYYPLNFWHGKHGINYTAIDDTFGRVTSGELSADNAILGQAERTELKDKRPVSKAEQYFVDKAHIIDLDDRQRYYYGLSPLNPDWDRVVMYSVTHSTNKRSEIFFECDHVKKLIYEELSGVDGYKYYLESDMDVATNNRQMIIPKTARGREQNLTPSILKTPTHMLAQLQVYLKGRTAGVISFNCSNDQELPHMSGTFETKADFAKYTEKYIASCPEDYELQLNNFVNRKRVLVKFTAGDIFRAQITPTLYTYGLILGKVRQLETWPEIPVGHPMKIMMTQPLIIRQYGIITSNSQMKTEKLDKIPLLEAQFAQDSEILWETYPIVCHKKLDEIDVDFGFGINNRLRTIVWGLSMHVFDEDLWDKAGFEKTNEIGVCTSGFDKSVSLTYGVFLNININRGSEEPDLIHNNEKAENQKKIAAQLLGLDEKSAFDDFAMRYGGITRKQYIEFAEERFKK